MTAERAKATRARRGFGAPRRSRPRRHSVLYDVYLHSWLWRLRRRIWFAHSDGRCEDCGRRLSLHRRQVFPVVTVHHETYARLGRERRADVALLCWPCHCKRDPRRPYR